MPNAKHKDISRIDSESTHGWNVRVRFQGKTKCKLFSDKKYGNRNSALIIAISWRNSTEKILVSQELTKLLLLTRVQKLALLV